jgi:hypothetical protein
MRRFLVVLAILLAVGTASEAARRRLRDCPLGCRLDRLSATFGFAGGGVVTPTGPPGPPTGLIGTAPDPGQVSVAFTAPVDAGASPVLSYECMSHPDAGSASKDGGSPVVVAGLANGSTYTFTCTASNAVGPSVASVASAGVTTPASVIDLQAFVDGGVGLATISGDFCSLLTAGNDAGIWACLREDGGYTGTSGFVIGSGGTQDGGALATCPNGASCGVTTYTTTTKSRSVSVGGTITHPRAFTACGVYEQTGDSVEEYGSDIEFPKSGGGYLYAIAATKPTRAGAAAGVVRLLVGASWIDGTTPTTFGARQIYCIRSDGTATEAFLDGTKIADAGVATGDSLLTNIWSVFEASNWTGGAFHTVKKLSDADLSTLTHATLADTITTTTGTAITFARSSEASCLAPDGTQVWLPPNRPCVTQPSGFGTGGALALRPASTNYAIKQYYQALTGGYTATNTTITNNQTGVDNLPSAYKLQASVDGGHVDTTTGISITATSLVASAWVKAAAGTPSAAIRLVDADGGTTACTGSATTDTTNWTQIKCASGVLSGDPFKIQMYGGGTGGTGTNYFYCPMLEVGTVPSDSCIRTGATAATRTAETATVPTPSMTSGTTFCQAARVKTHSLQASTNTQILRIGDTSSPNTDYLYYGFSATPIFKVTDNAGGYLSTSASYGNRVGWQDRVMGCTTGGVLQMFVDGGTEIPGTINGTGDGGIASPAATMSLGGTGDLDYLGEVCLGNFLGCK